VNSSARERLIETASRLFHLRSYSSVGIQELCEEAEVRRGSFYYYFPSKEALVEAVLDYERDDVLEQVYDPSFKQTWAPLERFDEFLRRLHEYQVARTNAEGGQVGGCPIANLAQELASHHPKLRAQADAILDRFADMYQAALEEARGQGQLDPEVDTEKSAVRIRAYVQGLLETAKLRSDPDVIAQCGLDVNGLLVHKISDV
jgi:TetR/AcrR family transcriptional repressor of nem operon